MSPTYHDLHITTVDIDRRSIFDLPFQLAVNCSRVAGWELWDYRDSRNPRLLAGEYAGEGKGLRLDVAGHVIVDSLSS